MTKDEFYMEFAKLAAMKSKDPSTKVGAVLVNDKKILSIGYNGPPRNFPDFTLFSDTAHIDIKDKNNYMVHAELNAILNYGGSLQDLQDATLYVTVSPCNECAKAIAQVGISTVVYLEEYHRTEIWERAKQLFNLTGVRYYKFKE